MAEQIRYASLLARQSTAVFGDEREVAPAELKWLDWIDSAVVHNVALLTGMAQSSRLHEAMFCWLEILAEDMLWRVHK